MEQSTRKQRKINFQKRTRLISSTSFSGIAQPQTTPLTPLPTLPNIHPLCKDKKLFFTNNPLFLIEFNKYPKRKLSQPTLLKRHPNSPRTIRKTWLAISSRKFCACCSPTAFPSVLIASAPVLRYPWPPSKSIWSPPCLACSAPTASTSCSGRRRQSSRR